MPGFGNPMMNQYATGMPGMGYGGMPGMGMNNFANPYGTNMNMGMGMGMGMNPMMGGGFGGMPSNTYATSLPQNNYGAGVG